MDWKEVIFAQALIHLRLLSCAEGEVERRETDRYLTCLDIIHALWLEDEYEEYKAAHFQD